MSLDITKNIQEISKALFQDDSIISKIDTGIQKLFKEFGLTNQERAQVLAQVYVQIISSSINGAVNGAIQMEIAKSDILIKEKQIKIEEAKLKIAEKELELKENENAELIKTEKEKQEEIRARAELTRRQTRGYDDELFTTSVKSHTDLMKFALSTESLTAQEAIDNLKDSIDALLKRKCKKGCD